MYPEVPGWSLRRPGAGGGEYPAATAIRRARPEHQARGSSRVSEGRPFGAVGPRC